MCQLTKQLLILLALVSWVTGVTAQAPKPPATKPLVRELFVPFDDLQVLLEGNVERVFLSKPDYEELLAKAKQQPAEVKGPWWTNVAKADYQIKLAEGRATIDAALEVELVTDDLLAVALKMSGVGLRSAQWDDTPAAIGRSQIGPVVFAQGRGNHALKLEMVAPVTESAAQQTLQITLPTASAATMTVVVAGNVELKGGAAVLARSFDEAASETTFQLVPPRGPLSLVFSLNNRQKQAERVLVARSVVVDEVTLAYERIHARVAFRVLHGSTDTLRIGVPAGFEVTDVASPLLARWTATQVDGLQVLELTLREPALDSVEIDLSAVRLDVDLANWKFPSLIPQDTAGHVALAAVLLEDRLRLGKLTTQGILPIDASTLAEAIPASVLNAEPGSPSVRQVATYYAPSGEVNLSAPILRPEEGLRVVASSLLLIEERQVSLRGGLALEPQAEETFALALRIPKGWRVNEVLDSDGTSLPMEQFDLPEGGTRVLLRFPTGLPIGETTSLQYLASSVPEGWLAQEQSKSLDFPVIVVEGAQRESGAVAIHAIDDLRVTPLELNGLLPLLENEKANYGFADLPTTYAYYYDAPPYSAKLKVESLPASLTADIYSFYRVDRDHTAVHYEVAFTVRERRSRELRFYLPSSTPAEIALRGLNVAVKDYSAKETVGDLRRWVVQLAERQGGVVRLAIDFDLPHPQQEPQNYPLPLLVADEVDYQSTLVAVEGSADLQVEVLEPHPRTVDVGELSGAEYQLGRRIIGTYGYNGAKETLKINVTQHVPYELPIALVQRAEIITILDPAARGGQAISQSSALYSLRTKASLLEIELPPDATLWTVLLDGQPTKPQRQDGRLLISLPTASAEVNRRLQLLYEAPSMPLGLAGEVRQKAPKLRLPSAQSSVEVETADLVWKVIVPQRFHVSSSSGTVFQDQIPQAELPIIRAGRWLYQTFGGVGRTYPLAMATTEITGGRAQHSGWKSYSQDSAGSMSYYDAAEVQSAKSQRELLSRQSAQSWSSELASRAPQGGDQSSESPPPPLATPVPADPFSGIEPPVAEPPQAGEPAPTEEPAPAPAKPEPVLPSELPLPSIQSGKGVNGVDTTAADFGPGSLESQIELGGIGGGGLGMQTGQGQAAPQRGATWQGATLKADGVQSLEGVSSLPIRLEGPISINDVQFTSLGSDPELVITVVDDRRLRYASWGIGALIFVAGLSLTNRNWGQRIQYVVLVLIAASIFALLPGPFRDLVPVFDAAFLAGVLVALYFLVATALGGCCRFCRPSCRSPVGDELVAISTPNTTGPSGTTVVSGLLLLALLFPGDVLAQPAAAPPEAVPIGSVADLIKALDGGPAPKVPDEAVLIPYDPNDENGVAKAEKILVPYAKYVELWNRANPDKKIAATKPPTDFAIAGQSFSATLGENDQVIVAGKATIHVYQDGPVQIPLRLAGGVIAEARLDGEPARLQMAEPQPVPENAPQQQAAQQAKPQGPGFPAAPIYLLYVDGKGTKELQLTLRFGVTRQGGWRTIEGILPVHQAAALTLEVPEEGSEVRLAHILDRPSNKTKVANEKLENALPPNGKFRIEWRPKVAETQVDPSLTANSKAVFDVREDALRLIWQVSFQFRGAARESFELGLPADFLVERVTGENVRGWQIQKPGEKPRLDVTLLKPATGSETITVFLARRGTVGEGALAAIVVPSVEANDAVLHQGELLVRRSPRIELQTARSQGLSRNDVSPGVAALVDQNERLDASVLALRQYQAYRFASVPFALELKAIPASSQPVVKVQSILRLADRQTTLETSFELRSGTAPIFAVRALVPKDFDIQSVEPAGVEWSTSTQGNQQLVQVLFPQGQELTTRLTLRGDLTSAKGEVTSPRIEVLDVSSQEGELVVQADPGVDIQVNELKDGENIFLMQSIHWLQAEQHALAKVAIRYRSPDYQATFKRVPRPSLVTVQSITNLKVTRRAVAQTSILDFEVAQSGIREVVFQLPRQIAKNARIQAELLQQRLPDEEIAERPNWVRVRLMLQDDLMGQFRVLIEHDGLITNDKQEVALPRIETGRVARQLLAVESAGRDEIVIDGQVGLEQAAPQQATWRTAAAILGDRITAVYAASQGAEESKLQFHLQDRARVETAGARIGLSEAWLVVDASGAYRVQQVYRMQNFTNPYLEVELPAGAALWTAVVAGEPVKPTPGKQAQLVRLPLVKSAEGEADYEVVLKYGGKLDAPGMFRTINFPLIKGTNINVEQSVVHLHLPDSQQWFNFAGSMNNVEAEEADQARLMYLNKQLFTCVQMLDSANPFTRLRAQNNLKQLGLATNNFQTISDADADRSKIAELSYSNSGLVTEGMKKVQEWNEQANDFVVADNRERLNSYFNDQQVERSKNVVTKLGRNFREAELAQKQPGGQEFNEAWFGQNKLQQQANLGAVNGPAKKPGGDGEGKGSGRYSRSSGGKVATKDSLQEELREKNAAPQLNEGKFGDQLKMQIDDDDASSSQFKKGKQLEGEESRNLRNYQQRLDDSFEQQQSLQHSVVPNPQSNAPQQDIPLLTNEMNQKPGERTVDGIGNNLYAEFAEADQRPFVTSVVPVITGTTGMASLDITLPLRGQVFHFKTPRGDTRITGRSFDQESLRRILALLGTLVVVGIVVALLSRGHLMPLIPWCDSLAFDVIVTGLALLAFLTSVLPWLALIVLFCGLVRLMCRAIAGWQRRRQLI